MTTVDITPDKSLIKKLGLTGYRTEQAIAELIDNSIDARIPRRPEHIEVRLDFDHKRITISDNGIGMDLNELKNALTIAKETKKEGEKLGHFGLGMKSACSTLGKRFTIATSKLDSEKKYFAEYDEDKWLNDETLNWKNFLVEEEKEDTSYHGTFIVISKLKIPLYPNQISSFKKRFGIRYGPYLENKQIRISINSRECKSEKPEIEKGSKKKISIELSRGNKLEGWIGLQEKRSIKGDYGLHLYRKDRLISAFDKFGIRPHPEVAKIIGELSLDHVPVNFHKTGFIEESSEYREAVDAFNKNPVVIQVLRSSLPKKLELSEIDSVLNYQVGKLPKTAIDTRISAVIAKSLLKHAETFEIKNSPIKTEIIFEDVTSDLYTIEKAESGIKIVVNRNSYVFRAFKNPLILIGMIGLEAKLALDLASPEVESFLKERNYAWNNFVKDSLPKEEKSKKSREEKMIHIPNYSLSDDLIDLHDYLKDKFEHSFQFTGLSTLTPYLQNAYNKMIYNIQTIKGTGQELLEMIEDHGEFVVLLEPKPEETKTALEVSKEKNFIIIREYSEKPTSHWATPEKAWLDFYYEVKKHKLPYYHDEITIVLENLIDNKLLSISKLKSMARHKKLLNEIESYLDDDTS